MVISSYTQENQSRTLYSLAHTPNLPLYPMTTNGRSHSLNRSRSGLGYVSDSNPDLEPFSEFFEKWLREQARDLHVLASASKAYAESTRSVTELTQYLNDLIRRVISHYEDYYRVKSESAKESALQMLTPTWLSSLEDALLWIGGWRPSMAFHMLYSKSGLQFEARLTEFLSGVDTAGDLGNISASQLARVDELHRQAIREEKSLTESLAALQETVADSSMVELSHIMTELTQNPNSSTRSESVDERVESTLSNKEEKLEDILKKADDLRLKTLQNLVEILTPIQTVHFLIAAAELHLRVHEWGKKKDERAIEAQSHAVVPDLGPQ